MSYDEHYPDLMSNLGVPSFAMPFVLGASETFSYMKNGDNSFQVKITSDIMPDNSYELKLNEMFTIFYGPNSGKMHTNCTLPKPNHMVCMSEERDQGWKLIDNCYFSQVCKQCCRLF